MEPGHPDYPGTIVTKGREDEGNMSKTYRQGIIWKCWPWLGHAVVQDWCQKGLLPHSRGGKTGNYLVFSEPELVHCGLLAALSNLGVLYYKTIRVSPEEKGFDLWEPNKIIRFSQSYQYPSAVIRYRVEPNPQPDYRLKQAVIVPEIYLVAHKNPDCHWECQGTIQIWAIREHVRNVLIADTLEENGWNF